MYNNPDMSGLRRLSKQSPDGMVENYDSNFANFLDKIHGSDFSDDINDLRTIQDRLKHIKKEASNKYLDDLMYPERAMHAKIPNAIPFPTSSFKMHNTLTITPNSSGNFAFVYNPYFLTTSSITTFMLNTDVGLSGSTSSNFFTGVPIGQFIPDIYTEYRLVSASVVVSPKNSVLNMQGTLSAACIIDPAVIPVNTGSISGTAQQYGNFNFTDDAFYNQIVAAKDGVRGLYFPLDVTFEQFQQMGSAKNGFLYLCYGQGLQASSPCIRVDFYTNWEATPNGSFLQFIPRSMPSICSSDDKNDAIQYAQKQAITKALDLSTIQKQEPQDLSKSIALVTTAVAKAINTLEDIKQTAPKVRASQKRGPFGDNYSNLAWTVNTPGSGLFDGANTTNSIERTAQNIGNTLSTAVEMASMMDRLHPFRAK